MSKILNVLYQSDDNYAPIMGVSMTSLFVNGKDIDEINVYILNDNIGEGNIAKIDELCGQYGRNVTFIETESTVKMLKELNVTTWHGGVSTWLKLFSVSGLKLSTGRVLYLDCDTLIAGSPAPLCGIDFGGNIAAMTYDCMLGEYKESIGLAQSDGYFNAGVMLINQEAWIEQGCETEIANHLQSNRYFLNDQDVFSVLYKDRIKYLDCRYNFFSYYLIYGIRETRKIFGLSDDNHVPLAEVEKALENTVIHHMIGAPAGRPWELGSRHPLNALFDKYLAMSPWRGYEKKRAARGLVFRLQGVLYRVLPRALYVPVHRHGVRRYLKSMSKSVQV